MPYKGMNPSACDRAATVLHDLYLYYTLPIYSCQDQQTYHAVHYNGSVTMFYLSNPWATQ